MAVAAGSVPLVFGWRGRDTLLIETAEPLAPGPAAINVSYTGDWRAAAPGIARPDDRHASLERGAGIAIPAWSAGTPDTPWRVTVHTPATMEAVSGLPRATRSLQRDKAAWEFVAATATNADSLRVEVRPLTPHPAAKRQGGATHRRRRRH
jgi:hypothetical protein